MVNDSTRTSLEFLIIFLIGLVCGIMICAALTSWLFMIVKVTVDDLMIHAVRSTLTSPGLFLSAF